MNMLPTKEQATSAFLWDMGGLLAKYGVTFLVTMVLSRLLAPSEFGLVAMAMVFISVSQIFADVGLTSGLIQSREANSLTYSSIFYLNVAMGMFLFILFWFAAPLVADFYTNDQIIPLIRWLSLNLIFTAFNQVQQAILRRQIEFKKITVRVMISHVCGGIIAIVLAFRGWGVYALVAQNLLSGLIDTIILWRVTDWKPKLEFAASEVRRLFGFSMWVFLSQASNRVVQQFDVLIIGKLFDPSTVGFYTRASTLNSLVTTLSSTSISRVAFPLLSRYQEDKSKFERYYFIILEFIAFAAFGFSGCLILAGPDLIVLFFGDNWVPSVFILQVLALKSFTYPVNLLIVSTFLAGGRSKENFWYGNVKKVITLAPALVAIVWGFNPFLYAVVAAAYLNWLLSNWFVTISFKISLYQQVMVIVPYLAMFLLVLSGLLLGASFFQVSGAALLKAAAFAAVYFVLNLLFKTKGYSYVVDNLKPIWKRLTEKSEPQ